MAPDPGETSAPVDDVLDGTAVRQYPVLPAITYRVTKARLTAELATVRAELTRCDAKVNTLLAVAGVVLAATITVLSNPRVPTPAAVIIGWAGVLLVTTAAVLLHAIRPQLAGAFGFMRWAGAVDGQGVLDAVAGYSDPAGDDVARGDELHRLSQLARAKYGVVRHASALLQVALPAVVIASLLTALGR